MKKENKNLIFVFVTLVIIILAAFTVTNQYYETKYITKEVGGDLFAMAFVDENVGSVPLNVSFSSLLFNFEGTPTYHWDFGDGSTSNETNPTHKYTEDGEYTCNLTITDGDGEKVTSSVKVLVVVNKAPTVVVLVSPVESARPHIPIVDYFPDQAIYLLVNALDKSSSALLEKKGWIECEGQVFDPEGDEIVSYEWELTQPPVTFLGTQDWPTFYFEGEDLVNITFPLYYTYRWAGYSIKLTVTDAAGNTASDVKTFGVSISDVRGRRLTMKRSWDNFWNIGYNNLPPEAQIALSKAMWTVLGPAQTITYDIMEKVLSLLPENISSQILGVYNSLWVTQELKYKKPNFNPPNTPDNPFPADNATSVNVGADLSWNCSDPDGHPLLYDIYFGTTSPPPLVISGHSSSNFELGPLQPNNTYYWKIVAKDDPRVGDSKTVTGPIWSFTTQ